MKAMRLIMIAFCLLALSVAGCSSTQTPSGLLGSVTLTLMKECSAKDLLSGSGKPRQKQLTKAQVLGVMERANDYLMKKWPDPTATVTTNKERPSNLWTRATYYEGLMALHRINPRDEYLKYALDWAEFHKWKFRGRDPHQPITQSRDANVICAAQTYLDIYLLNPRPERIAATRSCVDWIIGNPDTKNDWFWVDALQMGMPVFAKLGVIDQNATYFDKMHEMYLATKNEIAGGLYNTEDHLWWRDSDFVPPYKEPNGEDCYWSRGNGWAYAALVRVLDVLPKDNKYRGEYIKTFQEMSVALLKVQRTDGFWNVSLHAPDHFGGKELSGTAFFAYGFAWGMNNGFLKEETYASATIKAWQAMAGQGVHPNGFLGYVQGSGKEPKDGQPVTYTSKPDFEDYGLGVFLLAGSEVYKYLDRRAHLSSSKSELVQKLEGIFYDPAFAKIPEKIFPAAGFGAKADGKTVNTKAIQAAIDAAGKAGGGVVTLPKGTTVSGALFVKSNVELRLDEGVVLQAIQDDSQYPEIWTRIAGIEMNWPAAFINIYKQKNVRITGKGIIDGNGKYWWDKFWGDPPRSGGMYKDYVARGLRWAVDYDCKRVRGIVAYESEDILIKDITIKRSGFWTVTMTYCKRGYVDGVIVRNNIGGFGPSSDGINTDSSSYILVENCDIDCNDDNLCIKAGKDADGLRVNRPAENIVYRNSITRSGHGLFTLGSETSGGMRNIEVYGLKAVGTNMGLRFKSAKVRGGIMENISFHHIEMEGVTHPFHFELNWYPAYSYPKIPDNIPKESIPQRWYALTSPVLPPERGIPEFRDLSFSDMIVKNAKQVFFVNAYSEKPMRNVQWENVTIEARSGGSINNAKDWTMTNVILKASSPVEVKNSTNVQLPTFQLKEK